MKAFLASVIAMLVIAIVAGFVLNGIDDSSSTVFTIPDNVRL